MKVYEDSKQTPLEGHSLLIFTHSRKRWVIQKTCYPPCYAWLSQPVCTVPAHCAQWSTGGWQQCTVCCYTVTLQQSSKPFSKSINPIPHPYHLSASLFVSHHTLFISHNTWSISHTPLTWSIYTVHQSCSTISDEILVFPQAESSRCLLYFNLPCMAMFAGYQTLHASSPLSGNYQHAMQTTNWWKVAVSPHNHLKCKMSIW